MSLWHFLFLVSPLQADVMIDVSPFITGDRKSIEFHIENNTGNDVLCDFIKVSVKYVSGGETIGQRTVSLRNIYLKQNLSFKQESGKEHIAALEATFTNPQIKDILGEATFSCRPVLPPKLLTGHHEKEITQMAVSADEKSLVTGDPAAGIGFWDLDNSSLIKVTRTSFTASPIQNVGFISGKRRAFTCDGNSVVYWDTKTGKRENIIQSPGKPVKSSEALQDGRIFLSLQDGSMGTVEPGGDSVHALPFSGNFDRMFLLPGESQFIGRGDGITLRDRLNGNVIRNYTELTSAMAFQGPTSDGRSLMYQTDNYRKLALVSVDTGEVTSRLSVDLPEKALVTAAALLKDGGLALAYSVANDGFFATVNGKTGALSVAQIYTDHAFTEGCTALAISDSEANAYLGMIDGSVKKVQVIR